MSIFGLGVDVPPDIEQPVNRRGVGALGASIAVGGLAATLGYLNYARRHKDVPDSPVYSRRADGVPDYFMRHYSRDAGMYGAWRWGLMGLGATAFFSSILVFALGT